MSCVLKLSAPGLALAVQRVSLRPNRLDGETAHFEVSAPGSGKVAAQIEDAISFLRLHKKELEQLMALSSASGFLDCGVASRHLGGQFGRLSAELVCLSGKAGLGLE